MGEWAFPRVTKRLPEGACVASACRLLFRFRNRTARRGESAAAQAEETAAEVLKECQTPMR